MTQEREYDEDRDDQEWFEFVDLIGLVFETVFALGIIAALIFTILYIRG